MLKRRNFIKSWTAIFPDTRSDNFQMMDIEKELAALKQYAGDKDFSGYDPYDALNSPIIRLLSFNLKYCRIAWTQFFRRFPVNLRPLFQLPEGHNPKGLGLFLWGFAKLVKRSRTEDDMQVIHHLVDLIEKTGSKGYSGFCWGYNFPWQSRAFFLPRGTPTIVNSSFIGHALLDTYQVTGIPKTLEMAMSIKDFILKDLNRFQEKDTICFSYTPTDTTRIHNANLLGASLLIRLFNLSREPELEEIARMSLNYSLRHQRDDGSWFYAETEYQKWIDSFHTGYNLQAIRYFMEQDGWDHLKTPFERGVAFYRDNFFMDDGTPKYYHDRVYPIDIHAPAQAIVFFSGMGTRYKSLTDRIMHWMITHLYSGRGYYYFRKFPRWTIRIPYMRWSPAWAFPSPTE